MSGVVTALNSFSAAENGATAMGNSLSAMFGTVSSALSGAVSGQAATHQPQAPVARSAGPPGFEAVRPA